jgi:hypothetical protein
MRMRTNMILILFAVLFLIPSVTHARVTEIIITKTESPTFGGKEFGQAGQYERLEGTMKCEVDPKHPLNALIVNIAKAPKNAKGFVEYDVDFVILKPIDMTKGNHKILYDTPNRGGMITLGTFNNAPRLPTGTTTPESAGNGFLMKAGYTIVSNGWQASYPKSGFPSFFVGLGSRLPAAPGALMAQLPVAKNEDGTSVVAKSREEYYDPPFNMPGKDNMFIKYLTYPTATLDKAQATLTMRTHERDNTRVPVPDWEYIDEWTFKFAPPAGSNPGFLYEFIYSAKDPVVYGLGFTSIRDVVSFLRYQGKDDKGNANPLQTGLNPKDGVQIKKAIAYGASQTGRIIKTFVVEGFNEDEKGKMVFDGINSHIGASRKNWLNGQFSHPGDIFGNDQFPFTYASQKDHLSGVVDGNLTRCLKSRTCPKIIHTDSESEIWSSAGSLVVTDTKGARDVKLPKNVRAYLFTGAKHGAGGGIDPGLCQQLMNPLDYRPLSRAVLAALERWVTSNVEPPPSRYPNLSNKTLVQPEKLDFPKIPAFSYDKYKLPAVNYNALFLGAYHVDYNSQPPRILGEYPVYVMKIDKDGNGVDGIRLPDITVPVATYTGWNRFKPGYGDDYRLCTASGSFIPFAKTKVERLASGDPRLSLEERFQSHDSYVKKVEQAAKKLVKEKFLLEEDAQKIIDAATKSTIGNPNP